MRSLNFAVSKFLCFLLTAKTRSDISGRAFKHKKTNTKKEKVKLKVFINF